MVIYCRRKLGLGRLRPLRSSRDAYDAARARGLSPGDALKASSSPPVDAQHRVAAAALERLRRLLAKMSRESRHEALQSLPREVQDALVAFMEAASQGSKATVPAELGKRKRALTLDEPQGG